MTTLIKVNAPIKSCDNMRRKLTSAKLAYLIKDEKKASAEYRKLGLPELAKDEAKHRRFLVKKQKQMEKKK